MPVVLRFGSFVFAWAALSALIGCAGYAGAGRVTVKGKLLDNGTAFVLDASKLKLPKGASLPPGSRPLQLTFIPAEGGDLTPAMVDADTGTFSVTAKPGRYKVAITAAVGAAPDHFNGKFSADKTSIIREVKADEEIVIDLAKP